MSKEKPTTKTCKHCKTEIPYGAKVCPQCRKKQGPGGCLIAIIVVVAIGLIGSCFGGGSKETNSSSDTISAKVAETKAEKAETTEAPIEYTVASVNEMVDALNSNAMKASDTYKGKYLEITGKLNVIDSSGKYISLAPVDEDFAIMGVQCYIKTEDQKNKVMDMSIGDTVTLKGKITDVGEILGYSLDIDEIN